MSVRLLYLHYPGNDPGLLSTSVKNIFAPELSHSNLLPDLRMRVEHRPEQRGAGPGVAAYEDEGVAGAVVLPPCRVVVGEGGDSCSRKLFSPGLFY